MEPKFGYKYNTIQKEFSLILRVFSFNSRADNGFVKKKK